jgi:hypothetical protein
MMDIKQAILILRQYAPTIIKPIVIEAIKEYFSEQPLSTNQYQDDQVVDTAKAMLMLGFKDRHSVYQAVEKGLPFLSKRPYKFRVIDIKQFNEANKRVKSSSR